MYEPLHTAKSMEKQIKIKFTIKKGSCDQHFNLLDFGKLGVQNLKKFATHRRPIQREFGLSNITPPVR